MTQQTDRLAALKKLEDDFNAFVNSGALVDYYHSFIPEYIELKKAALSQPAAHPEPDNTGALEALKHLWDEIDAPKHGYEYARSLYDTVTAALAKPDVSLHSTAVPEIEALAEAIDEMSEFEWDEVGVLRNIIVRDNPKCACNASLCEWCTAQGAYKTANKYMPIVREAARAYLKLSGQKEGE